MNLYILYKLTNIIDMENRAYKFRIYPTSQQETFLEKELGLKRLYWNLSLAAKNADHSYKLKSYKETFAELKPEALEWCKEIDSTAMADVWNDLTQAFRNFFASCNRTRKGKFVKPPKFKSKKTMKESIGYTAMAKPKFVNGKLFITRKLGLLEGTFHRFAEGKLKNVTINRTATRKWFVSILVEKKETKKNNNGKAIGIDWNCRDDVFLTLSDGTKVKCPRFLREKEKQLAHYQKLLSKKFVKGKPEQSQNYCKAKYKVAKLHEKVSWQRQDWLHKLSYDLAQKYQYVIVEDINLQSMAQMHHGKAVGDQGFGMLRNMIAYKTTLVKVSAKNTSKTCHTCGYVNPKVVLGVEKWKCPVCSSEHDRYINAALNILNKGVTSQSIVGRERAESTNACGEPRSSMKQEVSNPSSRVLGS